jgi:alpha-beta hydrolase superfamily lysophospholipase
MSSPDFLLTNLELRASNPDGTEGEGLSHKTGGIGGAGMVLVRAMELAPPLDKLVDGEPSGAAIVVHDLGDHGGRYEQLAAALSEAGWMVTLPDLRGHGGSECERGHVPGLPEPVRDLHSFREHVAYRVPDARSVVIGVGVGALFAMGYAKAHADEVNALVLIAPVLSPRFQLPQRKGGLMGLLKKVGPTSPGSIGWTGADQCVDPAARAAWESDPRRQDVVTLRGGEVVAAAAAEVQQGYRELGKPTLVLAGSEDPLAPASEVEAMAQAIGAEYRCFEGRRHDLVRDAGGDEVIAAIVDWIGQA